jgi:hypothetical protein
MQSHFIACVMNSLIYPAAGAWLLFLLAAVSGGALREALLQPMLGDIRAHQAGTLMLCLVILLLVRLFVLRLRPTPMQALRIGAVWTVMTILFEFTAFHLVAGHPLSTLLAEYDIRQGRLWPLLLLCELVAPWWFAHRLIRSHALTAETNLEDRQEAVLPERFRRQIDRDDIAQLPQRQYQGEVSVVNSPALLEQAMLDIRRERVLGFDTETRPAFSKGESYLPCLVQIATARRVYLLQLEQLDCARELAELMGNPHIVKAGVALAGDIRQLKRRFPLEAVSVVDLGDIAKRHGNPQTGLRNLTALFLGWRMSKGAKTTNWAQPNLSPVQIGYAATDAWASRELYLCFEKLGLLAETER